MDLAREPVGGGRLQTLAERLDKMPNLSDFVSAKNWEYGEGFVLAETGDPQPAPWLTGKVIFRQRH